MMPETDWRQVSSTNIIDDLRSAMEQLKNKPYQPMPYYVVVSTKTYEALDYCLKTKIISEWPGYEKKQGPDGKTWFAKKPITGIDKGRGSGNKASRRMGLIYYDDAFMGPCWK